jgi:hypothetical protein
MENHSSILAVKNNFSPSFCMQIATGAIMASIQWVPGRVWLGRDTDEHSPQSSADIKNQLRAIPSFSSSTSMAYTRTAFFILKV